MSIEGIDDDFSLSWGNGDPFSNANLRNLRMETILSASFSHTISIEKQWKIIQLRANENSSPSEDNREIEDHLNEAMAHARNAIVEFLGASASARSGCMGAAALLTIQAADEVKEAMNELLDAYDVYQRDNSGDTGETTGMEGVPCDRDSGLMGSRDGW